MRGNGEGKEHGIFGLGSKVGIRLLRPLGTSQGSQIPLISEEQRLGMPRAAASPRIPPRNSEFLIQAGRDFPGFVVSPSQHSQCPPGHPTIPRLIFHPEGLEKKQKSSFDSQIQAWIPKSSRDLVLELVCRAGSGQFHYFHDPRFLWEYFGDN